MKAVSKNSNTRKKRRAVVVPFSNVKPVAVKTRGKSSAMIPVSIKTTTDSNDAEALIAVEVQTPTGKTVKRAAVVPVTVKRAAKSSNTSAKRRARVTRKATRRAIAKAHARDAEFAIEELRPRQNDPVTRGAVELASVEESAVNLVGQLGMTFLHFFPKMTRSAFGLPIRLEQTLKNRAGVLYGDAAAAVDGLAA